MFRVLITLMALLMVAPSKAAEPVSENMTVPQLWKDFQKSEYGMMLFSILDNGANMGPGTGWFKPSETRYTHAWLVKHFDKDENGKVSSKEMSDFPEVFKFLDRDGSLDLTKMDFDWDSSSPEAKQLNVARNWLRSYDANGDNQLSRAEWDKLFEKLSGEKDYLSLDDLRRMLPPPPSPPSKMPARMMPSTTTLLKGLFSGEIGSPMVGPAPEQMAPDFTLRSADGKKSITLSDYRGKKPVALIFGSFT
jgi:hypothetical protein